jgi:hypothetical protein
MQDGHYTLRWAISEGIVHSAHQHTPVVGLGSNEGEIEAAREGEGQGFVLVLWEEERI